MPDIQRYVPAVALAAGCLLISGLREQKQVAPRMPMAEIHIPAPDGYETQDVVVPEEEQRVAGMSDYMYRIFQRDSLDPGYSMYVGYYDYQVQGKTIHSPKNCLPGAGWEQLSAETRDVQVGGDTHRVNRFLLANKGAQALVYYWYQGRGRVESSEYRVKWHLVRDAALYGRTEEALVRIVVPVAIAGGAVADAAMYARADSTAQVLAKQLIPAVDKAIPASPASS